MGRNTATAKANYCGPGFPYGLLQTENITSARCSRVVLSKLLAARKGNFLSLLVLAKKSHAVLACSRMLTKTIRHPFNASKMNNRRVQIMHQASVVQKVDSTIHWITQLVSLTLVRWIVIYPVDSVIQLLNNWGLKDRISRFFIHG